MFSRAGTPEEFLQQARKNLCFNFLRGPDVAALRTHVWRCTIRSQTLTSKRKVLDSDPVVVIEGPANLSKPCAHCYFGCAPVGRTVRDTVWNLTDFAFLRRELLDGRSTMVYSFRTAARIPKQQRDKTVKFLLKFAIGTEGTLWIDEQDRIAVKCEGRNYKTVVRARSITSSAEIKKGSFWEWKLQKLGDSWLPVHLTEGVPYTTNFVHRRIQQTVTRCDNFRGPGESVDLPPECSSSSSGSADQLATILQNSFLGKWVNDDPQTPGVTRFAITRMNSCLLVEMWGSCHPRDCYWGREVARLVKGRPDRLEVIWNVPGADEFQALELTKAGRLSLTGRRFHTYPPGRSNFEYVSLFVRQDFE